MSTLRPVQAGQRDKSSSKFDSKNIESSKIPQFGYNRYGTDSDDESREYIRPKNRRDENDSNLLLDLKQVGKDLSHRPETAGMSINGAMRHISKKAKGKKDPKNFDDYYKKSFGKFLARKESGLSEIRRQVEDAEMSEVLTKPKLVSKQGSDKHVNLVNRMDVIKARKERELSRLKREQEERMEKEYKELTFQPKINPNSTALLVQMYKRRDADDVEMYRRREAEFTEVRHSSKSPVGRQESHKNMPLYERQNITNIIGGIVGNMTKDSNKESNTNLRSPGVEDRMRQFLQKEEDQKYLSGARRTSQDIGRGVAERVMRNESGKTFESVKPDVVKNMEKNVSKALQRMSKDVKKELYTVEPVKKDNKKEKEIVKEKSPVPVKAPVEAKKSGKVEASFKIEESAKVKYREEPEVRQPQQESQQPPPLAVDYGQIDLDKLDFILNQYNRMKQEEEEEEAMNRAHRMQDEVDEGEEGEEREGHYEQEEEDEDEEQDQDQEQVEEVDSNKRSYVDSSNIAYNRFEQNATVNEFTVNEETAVYIQDQSPAKYNDEDEEEEDLEGENEEEIDYIKQNLMDIQDNLAMIKHSFKALQESQQNLPMDFRFPTSPTPQSKAPAKNDMHRTITFDAERQHSRPEEVGMSQPELRSSKNLMVEQAKNKLKLNMAKIEAEAGMTKKDEGTEALLQKLLENYMNGQKDPMQTTEESQPKELKTSSLNNVESRKQPANSKNNRRSTSPVPITTTNNAKGATFGKSEPSRAKTGQNLNGSKTTKNKTEQSSKGFYGFNPNASASGKGRSVSPTPMLRTAHVAAKRAVSPMESTNPLRGSRVLNAPVSQGQEYPSLFGEEPAEVNRHASKKDNNVVRKSLDNKELLRSSQILKESAYKTLAKFNKGKLM